MDILLERILLLIDESGVNDQELIKAIRAPKNAVSEWRALRNASYKKYAYEISRYFNVSLDWLYGLNANRTIENTPAENNHDKSVKMLMDLWSQLTPSERLELVAVASELLRNRKGN